VLFVLVYASTTHSGGIAGSVVKLHRKGALGSARHVRAGNLTKVGVRFVKEVVLVVVEVRVSGGGGSSSGSWRLQPHQGAAPVQDETSGAQPGRK
jgi:hypothetical protein